MRRALELAIKCGEHLVERALPAGKGYAWYNQYAGDVPLAGFSHGAGGIAYALLELAAATGDERFGNLAQKGMAYERGLFSPKHGNWPDMRRSKGGEIERPSFMHAWCHGAPGIGLGRLLSLRWLDEPDLKEEIAIALGTTSREGFGFNDCLCHGDLGNAETFIQASNTLNRPHLFEEAQKVGTAVLHGWQVNKRWRCGVPMGVLTPGLMTGLAGIGVGLLRLADPDQVPSVLALEAARNTWQPVEPKNDTSKKWQS